MATAHRSKKTGPAAKPSKARKPVYEPVLDLPPLPYDQHVALKDNIALNGILQPIVVDSDGPVRRIIDGNHRKRIADELGYDCPEIVRAGLGDQEKRTLARARNLARRQLDQAGKRALIADQLRETPDRSNRWIGEQLGVSHPTVASVRREMESTGNPIQCPTRLGADNRVQPAHKPAAVTEANGKNGHSHEPLAPAASTDDQPEISLDGFDEEEDILRAAAEIRQRRVADQLHKAQERRRTSQPAALPKKRGTPILHGDCNDLIPTLKDGSVGLVLTSPPYAEQRDGHYAGIPEDVYPEYTVKWVAALWPKLTKDGSVLIVIRPHLRDGVLSDYVLRTRLALRDAGWNECEELIWYKPDAPPPGSLKRPRRTWESVLWFSKTPHPYCDLKACGKESDRLGFGGSLRFGIGGDSPINGRENVVRERGVARVADAVVAPIGCNEPGVDHPAVFPLPLAEQLIRTFSVENDLVLDPFCGSRQALLAAKGCKRRFLGIDREEKYVKIALGRLGK
jgi:DNA modification methylase